jgi:hypothetical protein
MEVPLILEWWQAVRPTAGDEIKRLRRENHMTQIETPPWCFYLHFQSGISVGGAVTNRDPTGTDHSKT